MRYLTVLPNTLDCIALVTQSTPSFKIPMKNSYCTYSSARMAPVYNVKLTLHHERRAKIPK